MTQLGSTPRPVLDSRELDRHSVISVSQSHNNRRLAEYYARRYHQKDALIQLRKPA